MKKTRTWLIVLFAVGFAIALYFIFRCNLEERPGIDDNWEKYWDEYFRSVELAWDALQARHDGRTNDFECIVEADLFDGSLRKAIRYFQNYGRDSEVDKFLKIYVYRYVVDLAATPRASGGSYDSQTIDLFRTITATQPALSDILVDPESESFVAEYIELSIREYEDFHAGLLRATQMTNGATHANPSP